MNKDCMKIKYDNLSIWDRIEKSIEDNERFLESIKGKYYKNNYS